MRYIDALLNRITMYRLILYYLLFLVGAAVILSLFGRISYSAPDIIGSSLFLVAICWITNKIFARVFHAPTNVESVYITALILALIITPSHTVEGGTFLAAAGGLAMASKYMLAINKRHVWNPAAIAVMLTSLGAGESASWWVGSLTMLPVVVLGGLLVVRKIRRGKMVAVFLTMALLATTLYSLLGNGAVSSVLHKEITSSALFFLAFVMLTEPLTAPTTPGKQIGYAILVALLFPPQVHFDNWYGTPEIALVVGNIFSYLLGSRAKILLRLRSRTILSPDIADFTFIPEKSLTYQPGQYMECTLQHPHTDSRGARRYFTLASSPTEPEIRIGIKMYQKSSSYKHALLGMDSNTPFVAAQVSGDFTLPKDARQKIAFIAGGIGITPYRSMLKYLLDRNEPRPIIMLYTATKAADLVYTDVIEDARQRLKVPTFYIVSESSPQTSNSSVQTGHITSELIQQTIPDYAERLFYLCGPPSMIHTTEAILRKLEISHRHIKKDFFSGY